VDTLSSGKLFIGGKEVAIKCPRDAISHGIAFITEDRKEEGLVLGLSILENLTMAIFRRLSRCGVITGKADRVEAASSIARMGIKCASAVQRVRALSGGNQQKVVIGKWLATNPSILIMDEPTRGIDVGFQKPDLRRSSTPSPTRGRASSSSLRRFLKFWSSPTASSCSPAESRPPNSIRSRPIRTTILHYA
jgi:ABC-type sugar transport system ATPase subunit